MYILFICIITAGFIPAFSFWLLSAMWVFITGQQRAYEAGLLAPEVVLYAKFCFAICWLWDVWCNLLCMLVFLELTNLRHEPTVSDRLRRLVQGSDWRARLATWFATRLINPYSVGAPHILLPTAVSAEAKP